MNTVLQNIADDITLIDSSAPTALMEICNVMHQYLYKRFDLKNKRVDYTRNPAKELLATITSSLYKAIWTSDQKFLQFTDRDGDVSCLEFDLLAQFGSRGLKLPLDFQFPALNVHNQLVQLPLIALVDALSSRATDFMSSFEGNNIKPLTITTCLAKLEEIDTDVCMTAPLLIRKLLEKGYQGIHADQGKPHDAKRWIAEDCIYFLRANAIHGLRSVHGKESYQPVIPWAKSKEILESIELDFKEGRFKLDAFFAKQLFQIYASHGSRDFPETLLKAMKGFIPQFEAEAHGSGLEQTVQDLFTQRHGVLDRLRHHNISLKNIDFKNPIMKSFGLETDIKIEFPEVFLEIACQVDGDQFHSVRSVIGVNKPDLKTKFRDFCFEQSHVPCIKITPKDATVERMTQLIEEQVLPLYYAELAKKQKVEERAAVRKFMHASEEQRDAQVQAFWGPLNSAAEPAYSSASSSPHSLHGSTFSSDTPSPYSWSGSATPSPAAQSPNFLARPLVSYTPSYAGIGREEQPSPFWLPPCAPVSSNNMAYPSSVGFSPFSPHAQMRSSPYSSSAMGSPMLDQACREDSPPIIFSPRRAIPMQRLAITDPLPQLQPSSARMASPI